MNSSIQLSLPALGFGTSRMGHYASKAEAIASLQIAYENGIRYFDTAPIYAYGWSEKLMGTFQQGKRDKLVITTKIGLHPSPILAALPFNLLSRLRQLARLSSRKGNNGLPPGVSHPLAKRFDTKSSLSSLHASLKRLRTDYIDIVLLHESTVQEANDPDALAFMEQIQSSGMVRAVGIGSALNKLDNLKQLDPLYTVVQHEFDILIPPAQPVGSRMMNTHGLLEQVKRIQAISMNTAMNVELQQVCHLDLRRPADRLNFCLAGARYTHPSGVTLFSSTSHDHIMGTIRAWDHPALNATQFQQATAIIRKHIERI